MDKKVLVAYGSTNGSTAEIAGRVGEVLAGRGLDVEGRAASEVTDVAGYDAVVLGGGLYAGRWQRDARRFARRYRTALAARPVWLFSSGPLDPSASERDIPAAPGVQRVADRIGSRGHITFGGRLEGEVKGRLARMIVNSGKGGDYRDFDRISAWAAGVARELTVPAE